MAENQKRPHSLVVGGTGMLRGVALYLAEQGHLVSVIARNADRLASLVKDAKGLTGLIHPLAVDYRNSDKLAAALQSAQSALGPLHLVVCWIHSTAPNALQVITASTGNRQPCRFVHVSGSATVNPLALAIGQNNGGGADGLYQSVVLGYQREQGRSRWLSDEEVAAGVIDAIESSEPLSIVGTVSPWALRP